MGTYPMQLWRGNWSPKCKIQWKVTEAFWRGWAGFCNTCVVTFFIAYNLLCSLLLEFNKPRVRKFGSYLFPLRHPKVVSLWLLGKLVSINRNRVSVILIIFSFRVKKKPKKHSLCLWYFFSNLRIWAFKPGGWTALMKKSGFHPWIQGF